MSSHIVIVGGGITGMAAAYALATGSPGVRCTLVEQEAQLGGKLRTERVRDCLIENGPDSFLSTKPWAADLCRALGLGERLIGTRPGRAVFVAYRGRLHPLPEGLALGIPIRIWPMVRTSLLSPLEKVRAAADLVLPRRRSPTDESVGSLIRRRLGDAVVARLAGPLLGGIYAGDPDCLSVRATFPLLEDWETEYRSLILAARTRRRRGKSGRGMSVRIAPNTAVSAHPRGEADGAGMSADSPSPMFLSLIEGVGELVGRLETSLRRTTVLTGRAVTGIAPQDAPGRTMCHVDLDDGRTLACDALLLATPAYVTARLLEPFAPSSAALLRSVPYVSTAAVTLAYRRDEIRHPLEGHGFVVARGEPLHITACTWVSSKWPHRAPPDIALLRCYLGAAGRESLVDEDEARLVVLSRADLDAMMGIDAEPVFSRVTRWHKAMPQYLPGHLERLTAIETGLQHLPRVALAGAGYRGIGIPDCIRQGTEAARRLAGLLQPADTPAVSE